MALKVLKVLIARDEIALEYEVEPGYPDTERFSRAGLGKGTLEEQVKEAALRLRNRLVWHNKPEEQAKALCDIANEALKPTEGETLK